MKIQHPILSGSQVAEIELVYKSKMKPSDRPVVKTSADSAQLLRDHWNADTIELVEAFKVLYLNRANRAIGIYQVSKGGLTGTVADIRLIMAAAIRLAASAIIIAHNHPSGNLKPSRADEELTQKIKQAGAFLDIKLLDHIILTTDESFSFADEGLL